MTEKERLTDLFTQLGATDPESWASSQVDEGINQLGRYLFLKEAWARVIDDDSSWIDREIKASDSRPNDPYSGTGQALAALISEGANRQLLTDVVRGMQAELLFDLCSLMDDPGDIPEVPDIDWCLMEVSEDGSVLRPIQALHESVLEMDPTGREMRPR